VGHFKSTKGLDSTAVKHRTALKGDCRIIFPRHYD